MAISKAQGQTLKRVATYTPSLFFPARPAVCDISTLFI